MSARKELLEKEKSQLLDKASFKNNPIFTDDHILDFYEMFHLYADPRTKKADVRDILVTAKTLGLHQKHSIVANALEQLAASFDDVVDFETFIKGLTEKMGNPFDANGRTALFELVDVDQKGALNSEDLARISDELQFNLTEQDIKEVIHNVAGYEAEDIPQEKFEKYLARKVNRRHIEQELLKNK